MDDVVTLSWGHPCLGWHGVEAGGECFEDAVGVGAVFEFTGCEWEGEWVCGF